MKHIDLTFKGLSNLIPIEIKTIGIILFMYIKHNIYLIGELDK